MLASGGVRPRQRQMFVNVEVLTITGWALFPCLHSGTGVAATETVMKML
jgi:hypothetical protein